MDDRDRRAPVALAGDTPVAQPVRDLLLAQPLGREISRYRVDRRYVCEAIVLAGVPQCPRVLSSYHGCHASVENVSCRSRSPAGSASCCGEREVALVVRRHAITAPSPGTSARSCRPRPRPSPVSGG
jgi:hypothetical protein